MVRLEPGETGPLAPAVNESLEELAPWMPWAQSPATFGSIGDFLEETRARWADLSGFGYVLRHPRTGSIIGACALHARLGPGALEIGHWGAPRSQRAGVATAAAAALTDAALALSGVTRTEIHCDESNNRSAAVPARLGCTLVGITDRQPDTPASTGRFMTWVLRR